MKSGLSVIPWAKQYWLQSCQSIEDVLQVLSMTEAEVFFCFVFILREKCHSYPQFWLNLIQCKVPWKRKERGKEHVNVVTLSLSFVCNWERAQVGSYLWNTFQRVALMESHLIKYNSVLAASFRNVVLLYLEGHFCLNRITFSFCLIRF